MRVATRMRPKRAAELIGGTLYWIVKHRLIAGVSRSCASRTARTAASTSSARPSWSAVAPMPARAHQGWRYLEDADAPDRR